MGDGAEHVSVEPVSMILGWFGRFRSASLPLLVFALGECKTPADIEADMVAEMDICDVMERLTKARKREVGSEKKEHVPAPCSAFAEPMRICSVGLEQRPMPWAGTAPIPRNAQGWNSAQYVTHHV